MMTELQPNPLAVQINKDGEFIHYYLNTAHMGIVFRVHKSQALQFAKLILEGTEKQLAKSDLLVADHNGVRSS